MCVYYELLLSCFFLVWDKFSSDFDSFRPKEGTKLFIAATNTSMGNADAPLLQAEWLMKDKVFPELKSTDNKPFVYRRTCSSPTIQRQIWRLLREEPYVVRENGITYRDRSKVSVRKEGAWKLKHAYEKEVRIDTKTHYVIIARIAFLCICVPPILAGVLNCGKRDNVLERIFDGIALFAILNFVAWFPLNRFKNFTNVHRALLLGYETEADWIKKVKCTMITTNVIRCLT